MSQEVTLVDILQKAFKFDASDIHLTVGRPPCYRVNGDIIADESWEELTPESLTKLTQEVIQKTNWDSNFNAHAQLQQKRHLDFSFSFDLIGRFRVNVFFQKNTLALSIRVLSETIPSLTNLGLPEIIKSLCYKHQGLILVTGPTGSGKSTTLAAMINEINENTARHILTLEDPIEYIHPHKKSIVNQREIKKDVLSFPEGLWAALREDPDIILVGELRDLETISTAITAAETGHLVLATLHTLSATSTIDRIIDVFPPHQQHQIRAQLAEVLEGIISQRLLPGREKKLALAIEVLVKTNAVANLIREGKTHQISNILQMGAKDGMIAFDNYLKVLLSKGLITRETCLSYAFRPESF